jgi:hypothetical protein
MILNIEKIMIKNDTTFMVNNLPTRHKLHNQVGNRGNIKKIKRVIIKSVMSSNRKRRSISTMNNEMVIRMQRRKMGGMRSSMERATRIKIPWQVSREGAEACPEVVDWEAVAEHVSIKGWVIEPTTSSDVESTRRWSSMSIFYVSEVATLLSYPPEPKPPVPYKEWWIWAFWAFLFL